MKTTYSDSVIRQCMYESEQWERLLAFLKQENAFCKSRLAEVVAGIEDDATLIEAEEFNDQFLSQDNMINFLAIELKKHSTLLQRDFPMDGELLKDIIKKQRILTRNIQNAEDIFSRTKKSFSIYLVSLL
jgi:hypothetical protein